MTDRQPEPMSAQRGEPPSRDTALLDGFEPETVEDLDVDENTEDVRGGTTFRCPTSHRGGRQGPHIRRTGGTSMETEQPDEPLEEVDAEIVEDLDVDEDDEDVRGGTSLGCRRV